MLRKIGKPSSGGRASPPLSIIGVDVHIVGNITTEGEIQIDGQVDGDISCHALVVGPAARIAGEIIAEAVRIHGEVTGRLAADSVVIGRTGRVAGDICHGSLEIEAGAQVEGHILRKDTTVVDARPAEPQAALPQPQAKPAQTPAISGPKSNGAAKPEAVEAVVEAEPPLQPAPAYN